MTGELEKRVGNWFKPDPKATKDSYVSAIDPENKILSRRGKGGPGRMGQSYALMVEGRVYIVGGLREQILDEDGNGKRDPNGRQGFYGYRWFDVQFERSLEDPITKEKFYSDELSDDAEFQKAVEISVEFLGMLGLLNLKVPPIREISFFNYKPLSDPRNPQEIIKVNQDVD